MKLVILDRDGVINYDSCHYIKSPQEWLAIPGSIEAIVKLKENNYKVAIATNQSGINRGYYSLDTLNAIHATLQKQLKHYGAQIDYIEFCPHRPDENCLCRKPAPTMLKSIANYFHVDLEGVPFVGDSLTDIQTAFNASCQPVLVTTGNGMRTQGELKNMNIPTYKNLLSFTNTLC